MFSKRLIFAMLVIFSLILGACAPQAASPEAAPSPEVPAETDERLMDPYIIAAMDALALQLGIARGEVHFVSSEAVEWSDSCLGLGGPAESCLQAITPGYLVKLSAADVEYEIHTDEAGEAIRIKP